MPKRLLRAFPTFSFKMNPDSVPLARESMGKDGRAEKEDAPVERKGRRMIPEHENECTICHFVLLFFVRYGIL